MKKQWYAIMNKKRDKTLAPEMLMINEFKHLYLYGLTRVHDYNGRFYDLFKANKWTRLKIFAKLIFINIKRKPSDGSLMVRKFRPYARHFIVVERIPGLIEPTERPPI